MMRFIYNLLWPFGLLLFLPGYIVKMSRRGGYREKFGQRLGLYDSEVRRKLAKEGSTWLHAVSVGEVTIALKLASQLRALESELQCVLTTTTTTGFALAKKNAPDWIEVLYTPLDFWPVMRRAFSVIRPGRIILIEAEVWPNLAAEADARSIPIALVNARLSPRSEKRFLQFRFVVAPIFQFLDLVCVQEPEDVERWTALGVDRAHIRHVGSIKYDPADVQIELAATEGILRHLKIDKNRPIILGGSTHAGEEEIIGEIFRDLRGEFSGLFLIVAPRHVERAGEVCRALERLDLRVVRRSAISSNNVQFDCLVIDTTGELRNWYSVATIVFVGKSLTAHGGQNPVEAILAAKPVMFGPNMENFAALACRLVKENGAIQVNSVEELRRAIVDLLRDSERCERLVRNARTVVDAHHGATARTAALIVDLVAN
ncbi:MAG TPA: 3-deoxy-D-manno-octulosonic acid transferase [Chthoniobacterales bacterium]|nr:3-deoxy-D-manno-octulosonic acid transferase [Chthoniobacterales bacterium]